MCILPIVQKTAGKKNVHNFFFFLFQIEFFQWHGGKRVRAYAGPTGPAPHFFEKIRFETIVNIFFLAKSDINGKMTNFLDLPILQKLKREDFFSP